MEISDLIIVYGGIALSLLQGIVFFRLKLQGKFDAGFHRALYFIAGLVGASLCGLAMYITEDTDHSIAFYTSGLMILFYVFLYNAPIRPKKNL